MRRRVSLRSSDLAGSKKRARVGVVAACLGEKRIARLRSVPGRRGESFPSHGTQFPGVAGRCASSRRPCPIAEATGAFRSPAVPDRDDQDCGIFFSRESCFRPWEAGFWCQKGTAPVMASAKINNNLSYLNIFPSDLRGPSNPVVRRLIMRHPATRHPCTGTGTPMSGYHQSCPY